MESYIQIIDMAFESFHGVSTPSILSHAVRRAGLTQKNLAVTSEDGQARDVACDVMDGPDIGQHSETSVNRSMEMQVH